MSSPIPDLVEQCRLDGGRVDRIATELVEYLDKIGMQNAPIFVGFDLNGPLVAVTDATMTPYEGVKECLGLLIEHPRALPAIVTGWDYTTAQSFADHSLGQPSVALITEKGMVASVGGVQRHLYTFDQREMDRFADAVFEVASERNLQVAVQPNASSGCQCVYLEGYDRTRLNQHPLLAGVRPGQDRIVEACDAAGIQGERSGTSFVAQATATELYELLRTKLPLEPVRVERRGSAWGLRVDTRDDPSFGWEGFEEASKKIASSSNRVADLNKDFSTDFSTSLAVDGGYSKHSAAEQIAGEELGASFLLFNVGDKRDDAVTGDNAVFFPQLGTESMAVRKPTDVPVVDGREYALVIARLLEIQEGYGS